jgi:histidinol dehydrogenase
MIGVTDLQGASRDELLQKLRERNRGIPEDVRQKAAEIVSDVRRRGDAALLEYTARFDAVDLAAEDLLVTRREIDAAVAAVPKDVLSAMERAAQNIRAYHLRQVQHSWLDMGEGRALGQKITPLGRVGVYVPGGRAAYPSSVLMNVLPARVAGVGEIIMATPPMRDGGVYANTLAAAKIAGVDRIYRMGGAQAVAALAFGTRTVPSVDKITGPGNIWVTAAKREVFGWCGIDMTAGPSEVLIVADAEADARYVAADMLAQAEHDPMASAMLVTDSRALAERVVAELERQLPKLGRREIAGQSLREYGAVMVADSLADAVNLANELAPEHLELMVAEPLAWLGSVRNAGAIFLGASSPEPLGDYMAGPNHVLPTGGTARFFSPLSVDDFVKKSSVVYYSRDMLKDIHKDIEIFAASEGLDAHARAAAIRFEEDT